MSDRIGGLRRKMEKQADDLDKGFQIAKLKEENQRLKDENKFLRGEFTFEEWVELQKQTAGESTLPKALCAL